MKRLLVSCVVNLLVPVAGYFLVRPHVSSDTLALGLVLAVPVVRTLWVAVARRRIDPVGVLAVAGFGAAVLLSLFLGGDSLPIKFNEAMVTGVLGLACLVSAALRKPLHLMVVNSRGRQEASPETVRTSMVVTTVMGVTCLGHAAVHVVFALTLSTGDFLIWSRLAGWAVILLGGAVVYWYLHGKKPTTATDAPGRR
ncbi:VC0807 family protein [Streptomyces sp. TS71-3]|uniref:VC0807 family protein n=1 Tax=Streptomyces sp. TS71-3 TaxID=2733862 RepID=UPI001BB37AD2|nr:VC0807 family protein [Streptomyces sp. TS71-3]